jgi:D-alanyl-D-alanine carboxypeptidase
MFLLLSLLISPTVFAVSSDDFNPNHIISDAEIQESTSMNRADIDAFLNNYNSYLSTYKTADWEGTRRFASDIIYRASQEHTINPKYLLVKLQKEQSLITDKTPSDNQLNGAAGYGITDGCGWSCDMYLNNKGFGKQVDKAAGVIRWYYDNVKKESWIKQANHTYNIDGENITPENNATAFLYTYTPHLHGNKNFWLLWQDWFANHAYPDGSLLQAVGDDIIYLIDNGKKRAFTSFTALVTRFDPKKILTVPSSELSRYDAEKDITLPNYSIVKQGTKYYLLDYDTLRPFANSQTVKQLGYHPDETVEITSTELKKYTIGDTIKADSASPMGRLFRAKEDGVIYYQKEKNLFPLTDEQIAKINFPHLTIDTDTLSSLGSVTVKNPLPFKDGTLILINGYNSVYVIEHGKKRHIATEEVFNGLGYSWDQIVKTDFFTGSIHQTGQALYLQRPITIEKEPIIVGDVHKSTTETIIEEDTEMQVTPKEKTITTGPTFDTPVDAYAIYDVKAKKMLASKNADVIRPLASLTKVMSTYEAVYSGLRVNTAGTYDPANHKATYHYFRIVKGEKIMYRDLLDAGLVSSLNTPIRIIVDAVEKDESIFITSMNTRAETLGMNKTTFKDVTGESEHTVGTARDYVALFDIAMKQMTIKSYLGKKYYKYTEAHDLDGKPQHYDYHSNELLEEKNLPYEIIGSKTGYLPESGANLAMKVKRKSDGKEFIIITLGNPDIRTRFEHPDTLTRWAIKTF